MCVRVRVQLNMPKPNGPVNMNKDALSKEFQFTPLKERDRPVERDRAAASRRAAPTKSMASAAAILDDDQSFDPRAERGTCMRLFFCCVDVRSLSCVHECAFVRALTL